MSRIAELEKELIAEIRQHCIDQIDIWRQIPYWALQANGRSGYSGCLTRAYEDGYWEIASSGGYYTVYLDLDTGELVNASYVESLARDDEVIKLGEINAQEILDELKEDAKRPTFKSYNEKDQEEWRRKKNIPKIYHRDGPRKNFPFRWDD